MITKGCFKSKGSMKSCNWYNLDRKKLLMSTCYVINGQWQEPENQTQTWLAVEEEVMHASHEEFTWVCTNNFT